VGATVNNATPVKGTIPSFLSTMTWVTGLRVLGLPLQFGVFVLVARLYDLKDVGVFAVSNAIWQAFKGFGPLGLDVAAMRFGPILIGAGRTADAEALERWSRRSVAVIGSMAAGALLIVGNLVAPPDAPFHGMKLALMAAGIPVFSLLGLQVSQLRARNLVKAAQFPESILLNCLTAVLITAGAFFKGRSIEWALGSAITAAMIVTLVNYLQLHRLQDAADYRLDPQLHQEVKKAAAHMFAGQALTTVGARVGPIAIGALLGTPSAGLFEAATRLGQVASVSTWAAGVAAGPQIAAAHGAGDRERLQRLVVASSWTAFLPAAGVCLVVGLFGKLLLLMFGSQFVTVYPVAVLVSLATAINAGGGLSGTTMYMTGHERVVVVLTALGVTAQVILLAFLVPAVGLIGAGVALVVAASVRDGGASAILPSTVQIAPGVFSAAGATGFAGLVAQTTDRILRRRR
jgi:O-antigen/teichoic acid export membrane protein